MKTLLILTFLILSTNLFSATEIEEILQRSNNVTYKRVELKTIVMPNEFTLKVLEKILSEEGENITFKFQHWVPKKIKNPQ